MVKDLLYDLMDKKLSGKASEEELLELQDILGLIIPDPPMEEEEIERAYARMLRRMKEKGVLFGI